MFGYNWYTRIKGGWKTVGAPGVGAFNTSGDWVPSEVGPIQAIKLSAYYAGLRLIAETMGTMSLQLKDKKNNVIEDHDLYGLWRAPNQYQQSDALMSAMIANMVTFGNGMSHIKRHRSDGPAYGLDFYGTELWGVTCDQQGRPQFSLNGETVRNEDVLHFSNFSLNGYWGIPLLLAAGQAMAMQIESNNAAGQTFKSGLRAGGFFLPPAARQAFTDAQLIKFNEEVAKLSQPQNTGKFFTLLPGMTVAANTQFRIDPVTAELLQSRHFGIEEILRYLGVPPPLVGHTDKASSWASSTDNLNQFLVTYCLQTKATRAENQIAAKLLGRNDRNKYDPKFNMDSLLRGDIEKRFNSYKIAREIGMYSANACLAIEGKPGHEGGDDFTPLKASTKPENGNDNGSQ